MTDHLQMGAINKQTRLYELPIIAEKKKDYECPSCNRKVILRKGKILKPHFAHCKSENPCRYYDNPGESEIHRHAKMMLKHELESRNNIFIIKSCKSCKYNKITTLITKTTNLKIVEEYSFNHNESRKVADVAYLENNNLKYVFEIYHTHLTHEKDRPDPWFELDASELIQRITPLNSEDTLTLHCIREYDCKLCTLRKEKEEADRIERAKHAKLEKARRERQRLIEEAAEEERERLEEIAKKERDLKLEKERLERVRLDEMARLERIRLEEEERLEKIRLVEEEKKRSEEARLKIKKQRDEEKEVNKQKEIIRKEKLREKEEQEIKERAERISALEVKLVKKDINTEKIIFTAEQKERAHIIRKEKSDEIRRQISLKHKKCFRCKVSRCNPCSEKYNKDINEAISKLLPSIETILSSL